METLDLFELSAPLASATTTDILIKPVGMPMHFKRETPEERATRRIRDVLRNRHPICLAFSAGKDSSAAAALTLNTARRMIEAGEYCPPVVVTHGNTGVESPEVVRLAKSELSKMTAYAVKHGISLTVRISQPQLSASWPVRVIGGRALPPYPSTRSDCSVDWKVLPNQRVTELVIAELRQHQDLNDPVVLTGVRLDESTARNERIAKRNETAEGIWKNEFGLLRLSPLLDWTTEDVWELLGLANAGIIEAYSDFAETIEMYRDASAGCVIVADMKANTLSKPCGTRTGCWSCTRVAQDASMANMIEANAERYGYLKPLARLRDFLSHAQYDWSLRQYVGRAIDKDGDIVIQADTFNPDMLKNLLRYTLTAQILSGVQIIRIEHLIAIDARWSMYGLCPPFTALKIFLEVDREGKLEQAPVIPRFPHTPVPRLGKIKVGAPSYGEALQARVSGLRHVAMEMFAESCGFGLKALNDGSLVVDVESDGEIEVDPEGAGLFLELEADRHIAEYCREDCSDWTWGYRTYLSYGTISIAKGRSQQVDAILKRTQWRQENNLHGQRSPEELEARCTELFGRQLELI